MKIDCVIGIDPGANGGIAVFRPGWQLKSVKMPKSIADLKAYVQYYKDVCSPIVFLEKLSVRPDDISFGNDGANMGKLYRIQKMMANYEQIKAMLDFMEIPYVQTHPMKWQNALNLRVKGEDKSARKRRYKEVAGNLYPYIKPTLWNADAILIAHFGRHALVNMQGWVREQLPTKISNLFEI